MRRSYRFAFFTFSVAFATVFAAMPAQASSPDTDRDGMPNRWETANRLNPNSARDAKADADHDGLSNLDEFRFKGLPRDEDTDNDGQDDGDERLTRTKIDRADSDRDGVLDGDEDADGDAVANEDEDDASEGCTGDDDDSDRDRVADEDENELGLRVGATDSDRDGVLDGDEDGDGDLRPNEDEDDDAGDRCSGDDDRDGVSDEDQDDRFGSVQSYDATTGTLVALTARGAVTLRVGDRLEIEGGAKFDCESESDERDDELDRDPGEAKSSEDRDTSGEPTPGAISGGSAVNAACASQAAALLKPGVVIRELETERRSGTVKEIKLLRSSR